jgi:cytochrome c oxidase cbb3-type subunit 4
MDNGTLFGVLTAVMLAIFVGGWIWIWRPSQRAVLDAASRLPLDETDDATAEERQ